jgi:protein deglycase
MAQIYMFFANGFEEIEGITVVDLLRRAGMEVDMVSIEQDKIVIGSHNIKVQADKHFNEVDFLDGEMIVLPGGMPGTTNLLKHEGLSNLIKEYNKEEKMLAAICAAPSVLGANGALQGKNVTCYPGFENKLIGGTLKSQAVVRDGNVITSRSAGTSILFAAEIISYFKGKAAAEKIKESIIY